MIYQDFSAANPGARERLEDDLLEHLANCFPGPDSDHRVAGIIRRAIMDFMAPGMRTLLDVVSSFEQTFREAGSAPEALLLGALIVVSIDHRIIPGVYDSAYRFPDPEETEYMGAEPNEEDAFIFPVPWDQDSTLLLIEPQAQFQDMRLDFLLTLETPAGCGHRIITRVAVECDSMTYHTPHRQMIRDRHRDQKALTADIYPFRVMSSEILENPFAVARRVIRFIEQLPQK